ncbi:MAG: M3 family oligoendopeptidase [Anaerolineales bacterium]|nr:M3 family oligoendopeptidase [Anaerolineales bacterium]MCX7607617.1 M3 family oligoendopeptidase [Anaerolineales bacterium]MDW8226856.1 M3 family oligoendopeptidase [Anaerolineales bacterium]
MTLSQRWDLSNVYPSLESPEYEAAFASMRTQIESLETLFKEKIAAADAGVPVSTLAPLMGEVIDRLNALLELSGTLRAYVMSFVATDSRDTLAARKMSEFQMTAVRLQMLGHQFQAWVGKLSPVLEDIIATNPTAGQHAFALREAAEQSRYLMSEAEESLAAELGLSGTNAWSKLQGTITSQLTVEFELDGEVRKLPMPALINLHSHPDESVRKRAYEAELKAWESVREPLAACLNGVKGWANTLNRRRGRTDALHQALDLARIDRSTLEAMLSAMQASFPTFRRYFAAKARRLGKEKLAWWDIFAPLGESKQTFTFEEAHEFIVRNFASFSTELAEFADHAFKNRWIDAEQREGKRGGAFCMGVPGVKESRILCNFDGSLDQVSTIAHELGHAFHNHCAYQAGKTEMQQETPMTLAETASILCETIVMEALLKETTDSQAQLAILETQLIGDAQVIVDIYSRFLFEKEVFERRQTAELSPDELCEIMERAQKSTYGDLAAYHPYMWTWKPHYYYGGLPFYNFPYAFGLLFGIGLYQIYQQRGAAFLPDYKALLASTGEATAADLAARFGIDIRSQKFWEDSLAVIGQRIERYCAL